MQFELYQQETEKQAKNHLLVLTELKKQIENNKTLTLIEERAMMHTLQIMIENAIGKARQLLKSKGKSVPVGAYDLFIDLKNESEITQSELQLWKKIIGLRNTIMHEYMKVDLELLKNIVKKQQYMFVNEFLMKPLIKKSHH